LGRSAKKKKSYLGTVVAMVTNITMVWLPELHICVWMTFSHWLPNLPVFISCYGYTHVPEVFCSVDIFSLLFTLNVLFWYNVINI